HGRLVHIQRYGRLRGHVAHEEEHRHGERRDGGSHRITISASRVDDLPSKSSVTTMRYLPGASAQPKSAASSARSDGRRRCGGIADLPTRAPPASRIATTALATAGSAPLLIAVCAKRAFVDEVCGRIAGSLVCTSIASLRRNVSSVPTAGMTDVCFMTNFVFARK